MRTLVSNVCDVGYGSLALSFVTPEITVTGEKPQFGMTTTSDVSNLAKVLNGVI